MPVARTALGGDDERRRATKPHGVSRCHRAASDRSRTAGTDHPRQAKEPAPALPYHRRRFNCPGASRRTSTNAQPNQAELRATMPCHTHRGLCHPPARRQRGTWQGMYGGKSRSDDQHVSRCGHLIRLRACRPTRETISAVPLHVVGGVPSSAGCHTGERLDADTRASATCCLPAAPFVTPGRCCTTPAGGSVHAGGRDASRWFCYVGDALVYLTRTISRVQEPQVLGAKGLGCLLAV